MPVIFHGTSAVHLILSPTKPSRKPCFQCHRLMAKRVLVVAVLASSFLPSLSICIQVASSAQVLWTFLAYDIGLDPLANVKIDLISLRPANNTYVMMITQSQLLAWHQVESITVSTGSAITGYSSYLTSAWRHGLYTHLNTSFRIPASRRDRYHIGLFNSNQNDVELEGEICLVNANGDQLPLQEQGVVQVLLCMAGLYGAACLIILVLLMTVLRGGRTAMHFFILMVIFLKAVALVLHWFDRVQVSRTGRESLIGSVCWQLIDNIQSIAELLMFLLVALGWKFLRSTLNVAEVRFAVGISVFSLYLGAAGMTCATTASCSGYQLSRYILHSMCSLVVMVAMNFNLQIVHAQLADAPASAEAGQVYGKLRAYHAFRWIFLAFIIAPTAEVFIKVTWLPWDARWVYVLMQQLRSLVIYLCMAFYFRPRPSPPRVFELALVADSENEDGSEDVEGSRPQSGSFEILSEA